MTPLNMSTSAKILRKNAKKFLIKGVVRKNQDQDESWKDEVIIISVGVDMKNMQSWKIFAYRDHASSFTWNGWWHEIEEKKSWILTIFFGRKFNVDIASFEKKEQRKECKRILLSGHWKRRDKRIAPHKQFDPLGNKTFQKLLLLLSRIYDKSGRSFYRTQQKTSFVIEKTIFPQNCVFIHNLLNGREELFKSKKCTEERDKKSK